MASVTPLKSQFLANSFKQPVNGTSRSSHAPFSFHVRKHGYHTRGLSVRAAAGDVSSDGITYLFVGAATIALLGTGFPILFSRKDTCPECDGAGFVRKSGAMLKANAARKDQAQIVCSRCNGLGKLNQIDKQ